MHTYRLLWRHVEYLEAIIESDNDLSNLTAGELQDLVRKHEDGGEVTDSVNTDCTIESMD